MVFKTTTYRVFGPKQNGGRWKSRPIQNGEGFGSLFGRMARKFMPMASKFTNKAVKAIKNSETLKDVGKTLLDKSLDMGTNYVANAIEGVDSKSNIEEAQQRLDQARRDISKIIRTKRSISSDESDFEPPIKQKRNKKEAKKKRKKYNLLKEIKNAK